MSGRRSGNGRSRIDRLATGIAGAALACGLSWAATPIANAEGPSALGAVSLDGEPAGPASKSPERGATAAETAEPDEATRPAQESIGLGRPNGMLSTRPMDASGEEGGNAAWWSMFDPRQNEMLRVIAALAVVIGLLMAVRFMLRKGAGLPGMAGRPSGVLQILARFPVARGQSLVVLQLGGRIVLLHQSSTGMRTLSEVTDADEVASLLGRMEAGSTGREAERFGSMLKRFQAEHDRFGDVRRRRSAGEVTTRDRIQGIGSSQANDNEVIDLTRSNGGMLGRLLGIGGGRS